MKFIDIFNEGELTNISEYSATASQTQIPSPTGAVPVTSAGTTTLAPTQQVQQDPAAQAKMMAQQALDRQNRKKSIQDQIKQTQEQLAALQKELATIR